MTESKTVCIAGAQLQKQQRQDIEALGHEIYDPMIDEADEARSAKQILMQGTQAILSSEVIVIEPESENLGIHVQLGQVVGMKDLALILASQITASTAFGESPQSTLDLIVETLLVVDEVKVLPHAQDIEDPYVLGACDVLTGGKGFYDWDEILEELNK